MPLFETTPVDAEQVRRLVQQHFDLELLNCIKPSQNHTFLAHLRGDESAKHVVRVTPDAEGKRTASIEFEAELLRRLVETEDKEDRPLPVCPPLVSLVTGKAVVREDPVTVVAYPFARGEPVVFPEWRWLREKPQVVGTGTWLGRLHLATQRLAAADAGFAARARRYTELHEGVLAQAAISPEDLAMESDPRLFGITHGDVNPSNYHWMPDLGLPCMFDWDQCQRSWFAYDVAQPIWGVVMLEGAGSPFDPNHAKVDGADSKVYTEWLLEGYEAEIGHKVDRSHLARMVELRRQLYKRFCTQALTELDPDSFMGKFCTFVVDWMNREDREKAGAEAAAAKQ